MNIDVYIFTYAYMFVQVYLYIFIYMYIYIYTCVCYMYNMYIFTNIRHVIPRHMCVNVSLFLSLCAYMDERAWNLRYLLVYIYNLLQVEPSKEQINAAMTSLVTNHDEEHGGAGKVSFAEFQNWYVLEFVARRVCVGVQLSFSRENVFKIYGHYLWNNGKSCLKFWQS